MTDGTSTEKTEKAPEVDLAELVRAKEELARRVDALDLKNQELLEEKRRANEKAAEEIRRAKELEQQKLAENGKFEQLARMHEEARKLAEQEAEKVKADRFAEKGRNEAMKLAVTLADGDNADLLADYIEKRIKYTTDGLKILDAQGNPTISNLDDLKREFESSTRFKALLRGSKASGGGAPGSNGGGERTNASNEGKTVTRSEFFSWHPTKQMAWTTSGGKTTKG